MKRILLNILLFTLPCISFSQKSEIGKSLSFETQFGYNEFWRITGNEMFIEKMIGKIPVQSNSKYFTDGKQSWIINNPYKDFHTYIFSYFNLTQKSNRIQVSIFSKTRNLQKAWLKVYCLNNDENTIKKDSLSWNHTTFPLSYPVEGSLEKQLMQAKVPLYYVSVKNLEPCYFIRLVGFNYTENQFYTSGFKKKFDSVVFIKQSTAYNINH